MTPNTLPSSKIPINIPPSFRDIDKSKTSSTSRTDGSGRIFFNPEANCSGSGYQLRRLNRFLRGENQDINGIENPNANEDRRPLRNRIQFQSKVEPIAFLTIALPDGTTTKLGSTCFKGENFDPGMHVKFKREILEKSAWKSRRESLPNKEMVDFISNHPGAKYHITMIDFV